ncbi:MAG: hypothetical protein H7246_17735, partial [Phycisphaerae bacterium]|nr:hypothetical protein [Saprospiraceae bacterium]
MKKSTLFFLISFFTNIGFSQTIYWSEDFEVTPVPAWTVSNGTWEIGVPISLPNGAFSGLKCAGTVLSGNYGNNVFSRLSSPSIIVPSAAQNPRLRFQQWFSFSNSPGLDAGLIQIKTASGIWTTIADSLI